MVYFLSAKLSQCKVQFSKKVKTVQVIRTIRVQNQMTRNVSLDKELTFHSSNLKAYNCLLIYWSRRVSSARS